MNPEASRINTEAKILSIMDELSYKIAALENAARDTNDEYVMKKALEAEETYDKAREALDNLFEMPF